MRSIFARYFIFSLVVLLAPALHAQREKLPEEDLEVVEAKWPAAKKTNTGIRYIVEQAGKGTLPVPGDLVTVLYTGWLLDGTIFDKSPSPDHPFTFRLGRDIVMQGWDDIIQRMSLGERRLVIIPAELAYGTHGFPPRIPRNATLVFEIEVVGVKRE